VNRARRRETAATYQVFAALRESLMGDDLHYWPRSARADRNGALEI
jgi:hypothetical protein